MDLQKLKGKKFAFAALAIVFISLTTAYLKYTGEVYLECVRTIAALFLVSQAFSDKKLNKE